jgi:glycerophosphoryl diester phosphodiesterase
VKPTMIASEGGSGYYPENTAYAVRQSVAAGVDGCELDFHLSADGVFVAHHDYRLNPALTRDRSGAWLSEPGPLINQTSLQDLLQYDFGAVAPDSSVARRYPHRQSRDHERIATFQDIESACLAASNTSMELWFEAKTNPFAQASATPAEEYLDALARLLPESPLFAHIVLIAFDWRLLELAIERMPGLQTGFLTIDFDRLSSDDVGPEADRRRWYGNFDPGNYGDSLPQAVKAAGGTYWSPYFADLSAQAVSESHSLDLKVSTWGADSEAELAQALATGVDSITTGYVNRARALMLADDR